MTPIAPAAATDREPVRLLVVDDESALLASYREILEPAAASARAQDLAANRARLFGTAPAAPAGAGLRFDVTCVKQAPDAVGAVQAALAAGRPFAVAFIDMRMPPGPDGLWAAREIRALDPSLDIVIVTAYSDVDPQAFVQHAPPVDKLFYLQKPFHPHEIRQLAQALGTKWQAQRALGLMDALRQAKEAAEAATLAKTRFLANMTHEIRTPLHGVLGMTELLLGEPLTERQRSFAQAAQDAGEDLLRLVDSVLDLAQIDGGALVLADDPFDLRSLAAELEADYRGVAARKGLGLTCATAQGMVTQVRGDRARLRQILVSLLDNAVKFTERGKVELRLDTMPSGDGTIGLRCDVADTGPGIDAAARSRIFEAFVQGDNSNTRRHGGAGLGLTIAYRLARLMGGDLTLTSQHGRGTTFHLQVRLRPAPAGP